MSRLSDRLRRASRVEPLPMGFGAGVARTPPPTLLCLVRLGAGEAGKAADAVARGADAVILEGADAARVKEVAQKTAELSLGVRPERVERSQVQTYREAGADFVVLEADAAAEAMLEEGIGIVLTAGPDAADTALRLLGDLPVDALLVTAPDGALTIARALELRRLAALSRTPLLVGVSPEAGASHLHVLREAGVVGVVLEGRSLDRLAGLKEAIASLPPRGRRRREERAEAVLPASAMVAPAEDEDEDDDFP